MASHLGAETHPVARRIAAHLRTPLYRNAYALVAGDVAAASLGMLYWVLAARLYSAEAVGVSSATIAALVFIGNLSAAHLRSALVRFLPEAGAGAGRLLRRAYLSAALAALIFGALFVGALALWWPASPLRAAGAIGPAAFVGACVVWALFTLQDGALIGLRHALLVPAEQVAYGLAKLALLAALAMPLGGHGIVASWVVPAALTLAPIALLLALRLLPRRREAAPGTPIGRVARFAAVDFFSSAVSMAPQLVLPLLVLAWVGPAGGAYFAATWLVATALHMVGVNLATSLVVEASREPGRLAELTRRALGQLAWLMLPLAGGLALLAPLVLQLFGPQYAAAGGGLLRALALAMLPQGVMLVALAVARVRLQVGRVLAAQAAAAVLLLGLSAALTPTQGIGGIGVAALCAYSLVAAALLPQLLSTLRGRAAEAEAREI